LGDAVDTSTTCSMSSGRMLTAVSAAAAALVLAACGGGGGDRGSAGAAAANGHGAGHSTASDVRISITPSGDGIDASPDRGIVVAAAGGRITAVSVRTKGEAVSGTLNRAGTVWHSRWSLDVSQRYTVIARATDPSGHQVTRTSSFRTFTPKRTFDTRIVEGYGQTYGIGIPIVLYFSQPISDQKAIERSLEIKTSKTVTGAWFWDTHCNMAPVCLYFRPQRYWPAHTRVSFVGHLDGVRAGPGLYGTHTLTQSFRIGSPLTVRVSTSAHYMNVYRNKKLFAHWPISSGRPGDDTPNGTYLTIEKANPVDMVGPGYNIEVPWSVRFTWSGDYLHDAYWSVGQQGFTNVSHGCVNMSPADAQTFYDMAVPGDPVTITGSPRPGTWDNGWTMWFLSWKQWLRGSALHEAVRTGRHGSTFISLRRHARGHHLEARR
jgi:lipoprotein-anchoring transpeptidase ErfK/SrfK